MSGVSRRSLLGAGIIGAGGALIKPQTSAALEIGISPGADSRGSDAQGPNAALFPLFHQVSRIVPDIQAAETYFLDKVGTTPFLQLKDVRAQDTEGTHRGAPGNWTAHMYLAFHGDLNVEIIQPVSGDSIYSEWLETRGPGIQHIAYICLDLPAQRARMEANGRPMIQSFVLPSAKQPLLTINYFDTVSTLGHIRELIAVAANGGMDFLYKPKRL
ncbi:MAG: VOC family protein [Nevskia sp.]|nr:VOC family protein [Nevskia sp.]